MGQLQIIFAPPSSADLQGGWLPSPDQQSQLGLLAWTFLTSQLLAVLLHGPVPYTLVEEISCCWRCVWLSTLGFSCQLTLQCVCGGQGDGHKA